MLLISFGFPLWIDPLISLFVAFNIFKAAWEMFQEISPVLLDQQVLTQNDMDALYQNFSEIKGINKMRSRGTSESLMVDMHVVLDPQTTVILGHQLSHNIQDFIAKRYRDKHVSVICHLEPFDEAYLKNKRG